MVATALLERQVKAREDVHATDLFKAGLVKPVAMEAMAEQQGKVLHLGQQCLFSRRRHSCQIFLCKLLPIKVCMASQGLKVMGLMAVLGVRVGYVLAHVGLGGGGPGDEKITVAHVWPQVHRVPLGMQGTQVSMPPTLPIQIWLAYLRLQTLLLSYLGAELSPSRHGSPI